MVEFKKLSEVEQIETASDNATVLVEEGGEIKRVPKKEVGGAGIPTAIIKDSGYDNAIAGLQTMTTGSMPTFECANMTFEEAYQIMANGEPLNVLGMLTADGAMNLHGVAGFAGTMFGVPCIVIVFEFMGEMLVSLYWTADGLSTKKPGVEHE
jgi:hypothetical protein